MNFDFKNWKVSPIHRNTSMSTQNSSQSRILYRLYLCKTDVAIKNFPCSIDTLNTMKYSEIYISTCIYEFIDWLIWQSYQVTRKEPDRSLREVVSGGRRLAYIATARLQRSRGCNENQTWPTLCNLPTPFEQDTKIHELTLWEIGIGSCRIDNWGQSFLTRHFDRNQIEASRILVVTPSPATSDLLWMNT